MSFTKTFTQIFSKLSLLFIATGMKSNSFVLLEFKKVFTSILCLEIVCYWNASLAFGLNVIEIRHQKKELNYGNISRL